MSGMWFSALEDLLYVSTVSHEQIISNPSVYFILGEFYCLAGWVAGLLCRAGQIPVRGFFSRSEAAWCLVSGQCAHRAPGHGPSSDPRCWCPRTNTVKCQGILLPDKF